MQNRPVVSASPGIPILAADEPPPVVVVRPAAPSPFLLLGDHAGNRIPRGMDDLGLDEDERTRHIAWDIGIAALGTALGQRLDATFIRQVYSRLVIDCNRRPGAPDSIPPVSDGTAIAANAALDEAGAAARAAAIHAPYQEAIASDIERRLAARQEALLISLHSFTPSMRGVDRPWQVGILHDAGDDRFARAMLAAFQRDPALTVGDNQPYSMDTIDFTIPFHAYPRRLPYVEIEIRQDLLADDAGVADWCDRVEQALQYAHSTYTAL
jgi:predicted N-formylglutamate amidohydrolase